MLAEQEAEAAARSYVAVIQDRIESFWSRPASARKGMKCELALQLVPTGRVINVTVVKSSGNDAFDRSARQAVLKAEQFKELQDLPPEAFEKYFRELTLVFNPTDLRL
jgi:colicin import membrane protein